MSISVLHLESQLCLLVCVCVTVAPTASGFSRTLFLFLLLEEELDVHATYGISDHVEHLVLQIQSRVPPFFDFRF